MGLLQAGKWVDQWYDTKSSGGRYLRKDSSFRSWVTADGSSGPTGSSGFKAEAGRYHLYVSLACPWAHRTLIYRKLKGLEKMISVSVVHWHMAENGWTFEPGKGVIADPIGNAEYLYQVYTAAEAEYSGRVTVPVLWDKQQQTIVSNESAEIIRMLNTAFDDIGGLPGDFYPIRKQAEIDSVNERVYSSLNNGVYKCGFATTQEAYEEALTPLFETLYWLEQRLSQQRYVLGSEITEADWRLFTTLVRFDPVYVGHFKCNIKRIADYPNISEYVRDLYQVPGISETVNMAHIKDHYYGSHDTINPSGVVPVGPEINYSLPHSRAKMQKGEA